MLFIIGSHTNHAGFNFPEGSFTLNGLWERYLWTGGHLGNDLFIFLSGYFLVNSTAISFRKLFNIWIRVFFYSAGIYALFISSGKEAFEIRKALQVMLPITQDQQWFASTYFVMYLLHPYVNIFLHALNRDDYRKFLLCVFIYWGIIPMLTKSSFQGNNLVNFVCLYAMAGYIRLWANDFGSSKYLWYGAGIIALNWGYITVMSFLGTRWAFLGARMTLLTGMMRPLTLGAALSLFIGFKHLGMKYNSIINLLASATFGVYLIHDNHIFRPYMWDKIFKLSSYQESSYLIPYTIAVIIAVYLSCSIIELIRSKIFRVISREKLS